MNPAQIPSIQTRSELGEGPEREIQVLFADTRRKVVRVVLRQGAILADHATAVPVNIHCLQGEAILKVGEEAIPLREGVLVPLEPRVVHAVEAKPAVTILLTLFREPPARGEP